MKRLAMIAIAILLFPSISLANIPEKKQIKKLPKQHPLLQEITSNSSGYYTPMPGQKKYVKSYAEDLALNGPGKDVHYSKRESRRPKEGRTISVNRKNPIIKPGTVVHIEGIGVRIVEDGGGGVNGIDIYFGRGDSGRKKAINWGRKIVKIKILGKASLEKSS